MSVEPLEFDCPRCGTPSAERYYGPCGSCRSAMAATMGADARHVDVARYEPKMNVVPNAVALKE